MFSVNAAGATAFGVTGLPGETLAAVISMLLGAVIGLTTERLSQSLAPDESLDGPSTATATSAVAQPPPALNM